MGIYILVERSKIGDELMLEIFDNTFAHEGVDPDSIKEYRSDLFEIVLIMLVIMTLETCLLIYEGKQIITQVCKTRKSPFSDDHP